MGMLVSSARFAALSSTAIEVPNGTFTGGIEPWQFANCVWNNGEVILGSYNAEYDEVERGYLNVSISALAEPGRYQLEIDARSSANGYEMYGYSSNAPDLVYIPEAMSSRVILDNVGTSSPSNLYLEGVGVVDNVRLTRLPA